MEEVIPGTEEKGSLELGPLEFWVGGKWCQQRFCS